jgi:uncharacterized protein (UPF0332 family)
MPIAESLPKQLQDQAGHLARLDRRRPSQANLRRAVSSAYYALFHQLVEDSSAELMGGGRENAQLRGLLRRAYLHSDMRKASKSFASDWGALPSGVRACVRNPCLPPELTRMAKTFTLLQEARHDADYDLSVRFIREEVVFLLNETDQAFVAWSQVRKHPAARCYLACLLLWPKMQGRS